MMKTFRWFAFFVACGLTAAQLHAQVTIAQGPTAPTYSQTLNFDEPGGPTGATSLNAFASVGISELNAGDGAPFVADFATLNGEPWIGTGNSFFGNFGVFIKFDSDLTEFSANIWDPSGPPSPFGGGFIVVAINDGDEVNPLAFYSGEPAWGGLGDPAINITTANGAVFDEVRILGNGFTPLTYADDLSWNVVPEPSSVLLLLVGALAIVRRRR